MKLPVIVDENGDLNVFLTVEIEERKLEVIDVLNGEYSAYDAEAIPLDIKVIDDKIKISSTNQLGRTKLLETVLKDFLNAISVKEKVVDGVDIEKMKLEDLLQVAVKYPTR